jgi:hypothetical protein
MASSVRRLPGRLSGIGEEIVNCPFIRGARKRLTTRLTDPAPRTLGIDRGRIAGFGAAGLVRRHGHTQSLANLHELRPPIEPS